MDADARSLVTGKVCPTCDLKFSPDLERCPEDNSFLAVVRRDPFIGRLIADKYKIVEILGMGGFSTVYKAEQTSLRRAVAVKILHAEFVDKPDKIRRFQHEAESISTLVHENVATVYDYGVLSEGQPYLVMEVAQGKTLAAILNESKPLDPERAVAIFLQACDGIAAAHSKGLIHRDIKPSNIVLTEVESGELHVKILDFGLAKVIADGDGQRENLTMTGEVMGTLAYMSPEQCLGTAMDVRTDIYSFGCVMYEVLSGQLPLIADTSYEQMNKHINEVPISLSKSGPSVPPRLVRIVSKSLQKDPDDRFENFQDLKDALLGVEPAISKEIKAILFSGGNAKLSKKKKSLKKKLLLSLWALALSSISLTGLLTFEQFDNMRKEGIEKQYSGKTAPFDCGTVAFDYPAIFEPVDKRIEDTVAQRFENRVDNGTYFELKYIKLNLDVPATAEYQRQHHKKIYPHFVEVKSIQRVDFGRHKLIHGYETEFVSDQSNGLRRERHVYWGTRGAVWKIKLNSPVTKDSKSERIYDIILDTVIFRPESKCTLF
ncbi:MAG: serine/threonine protein kinase [Candidatus Melainabacteria bacterium]|nr:serine/threonine protein kinase [Candidatus Melainabacteria bacterium]